MEGRKILFLTVGCINYDCDINFYEPLKQIFSNVINYNYIEKIKQIGKESMNAEIIETVRKEKPDYVLLHTYQDQVEMKTLDTIGTLGTKVIAWFSDDHWRFEDYSRIVARHVFCSVTTDKHSVEKYAKLGLNVIKSQWASNQNYYKKIDAKFAYDVTFIGGGHGKRLENLLYLENRAVPITAFGKGFGKFVEFDDMIKIFNASKINLNFCGSSRNDGIKQIKGRVFEVPMCGGFLLTEYADGLEEYYQIGKEIECFENIAEAVEKISYYLKNDDKRMEIANCGYNRALKEHTWVKRLSAMFDELDRMQPEQPKISCTFSHQERKTNEPSGISHSDSESPRKRILLTTSAAPAQAPFSTKEKRPPIGIGFLISVLRNAGHEVSFIDNYLQPTNFLDTDYLWKNKIDYVGIYANTICFRDTLRMLHKLEHLRQTRKWVGKIIVGGPHTTVAADTIPDFVDYIVQGEGERAILDIADGKVTERIVNYPRIENLDALPMPAWDCFVNLPYDWSVKFFQDSPIFTMNTSRGCPFRCTFCSVCSVWGRKYTYFSAERIVSDIEHLIEHYGVKGIYFREDNFTLNKERLSKFCNLLIEKGIKISWACESRVSNLSRETVELMARAGAKGFYFGVESGSQRILDLLQKDITVEQIKNAFKWCHEFGVKAAASVVVGVPGETESDIRETAELLKQIEPDVVWPNVFVGIPDSSLYRFVLDNRLYQYIDDRGLVYLQGHNNRAKHYYGDGLNAYIPDNEKNKDMTDKPKISVLISVYNTEKFIEQALKSIYSQTYQDFEVIIIDDASTDRTSEILVKMKDSRTFIYRNSENIGLTKSLNIGLKLCRGEYIARMDADDISHPQRFEKQVKFLDENPNCTVLGCWCARIDSNGEICGAYDRRPTEPDGIKAGLLDGNCVAHGTAMLRRTSLIEVGGYNEKYMYSQDYDLWLRLSEIGEIRNMGEYLYKLRYWPGTISFAKAEAQNQYAELAMAEALHRRNGDKPAAEASNIEHCKQQSNSIPKFSVIMANYNNGGYIAEAIESVLNQTFKDWELIIIEDCSTDNSVAIINRYLDDKRIRLIQHERNRGYIAALKSGIANVQSEYFGILDSDDCLTKDAVETMYSHHVDFPDAGLIYSQFMCCHEDLAPRQIGFGAKIPAGKTNLDAHLVSAFRTFKMADYLKTSGYDEDILYAEDRDISYKMEEVTQLKFVDKCLYLYRELPSSQSHDTTKAFIGRLTREKAKINALIRRTLAKEQTNTLVSVIMPAYNAAEYITEAIESVLTQSYRNFELILIDDGSTDNTKDIIAGFKDERIEYFYQENSGLATTHNVGIKKSKGSFLIKLDSDDIMAPDFIARHLTEFEKYPETDLVYCDDHLIDEDGKSIRIIERPEYTNRKLLIRDLFRCGFPVVPFRTCIRRSVFDKIGFFDEQLDMAEDYDMMRRFVKKGLKIHHLRAALYLRRMTTDSLSRNFTARKAKSHFEVVERFADTFAPDELFPDVAWDRIAPERRQLHAKCLAAVTCLTIGQAYIKSNAPVYAQTAFEQACSKLRDCLEMAPGNRLVQQLLQKSEFVRHGYAETVQQAAC